MAVIAMTREMGSLGKDVAADLADQMGLTVVHHELVEHHIAERLGIKKSAVHRFLEGEASLLERWKIDKEKLSRFTAEEILELAQKGNVVIRGWGAVAVLRGVPHVLRVRVCAPMPSRERVMMERLGLKNPGEATSEILQNDAAHARIMRSFFGVNWEDPQLYHVVLNTGSVPIDACVSVVRLLAERPEFQETEETRSGLADKLLESRVRAALGDASDRPVTIKAVKGKITLTGTTMRPIGNVEELVRSVPGVAEVENRTAARLCGRRTATPIIPCAARLPIGRASGIAGCTAPREVLLADGAWVARSAS
jgi:cytidylate kinase